MEPIDFNEYQQRLRAKVDTFMSKIIRAWSTVGYTSYQISERFEEIVIELSV